MEIIIIPMKTTEDKRIWTLYRIIFGFYRILVNIWMILGLSFFTSLVSILSKSINHLIKASVILRNFGELTVDRNWLLNDSFRFQKRNESWILYEKMFVSNQKCFEYQNQEVLVHQMSRQIRWQQLMTNRRNGWKNFLKYRNQTIQKF